MQGRRRELYLLQRPGLEEAFSDPVLDGLRAGRRGFVIAFRLKIRRAAFWAEPDDLTVRIKLAGRTNKLR